jgi:hypothetical protein
MGKSIAQTDVDAICDRLNHYFTLTIQSVIPQVIASVKAEQEKEMAELRKDKARLDYLSGLIENRNDAIERIHNFEANAGRGYCEQSLDVRGAIDESMLERF